MNAVSKTFVALFAALLALSAVTVAQAKGKGKGGHAPRPVLAAVHADVAIVDAKGETKSVTWDKGKVTAKSSTSITLERKDGKSVTFAIGASTKTKGEAEQGKPAVVFSNQGAATLVLGYPEQQASPSQPAAPQSANERKQGAHGAGPFGAPRGAVHVGWALVMPDGKALSLALDRGDVTAKSDTSITLKRADGQSVTLKIDSSTKVHAKDGAVQAGNRAEVISQAGTALAILAGPAKTS